MSDIFTLSFRVLNFIVDEFIYIVFSDMESKPGIFGALGGEAETPSTSKLTLPVLAKKVKKLASKQFLNLRMLLNGRGFSKFKKYYKLKGEIGQGGFGEFLERFEIYLFVWRTFEENYSESLLKMFALTKFKWDSFRHRL